jgi:hypothetical protein
MRGHYYNIFQMAIIQNAPTYSRQQSYRMLQRIPVSNHTACYNVFQTAITGCYNILQTVIIQNATTYSRKQSYRMFQHIPDSNHTEYYNIFQTAIL